MCDVKWLCRTCRFVGSGQRRTHVHGKVPSPSAHPNESWLFVVCFSVSESCDAAGKAKTVAGKKK